MKVQLVAIVYFLVVLQIAPGEKRIHLKRAELKDLAVSAGKIRSRRSGYFVEPRREACGVDMDSCKNLWLKWCDYYFDIDGVLRRGYQLCPNKCGRC